MKHLTRNIFIAALMFCLGLVYILSMKILNKMNFSWWLIAIMVSVFVAVTTGTVLFCRFLYHRFKISPMATAFIGVGIVLTLTCVGMYFISVVDVQQDRTNIAVESSNYYRDDGLFSTAYYLEYKVVPHFIKPEVYRIEVSNGKSRWEDKIYFTDFQAKVNQPRNIKHEISLEQYNSFNAHPYLDSAVYRVDTENNGSYLLIPFIYGGITGLVYWTYHRKPLIIEGEFREVS